MRTKLKRALFGVMAGIMVANTPLTTLAAYTPANEPDDTTGHSAETASDKEAKKDQEEKSILEQKDLYTYLGEMEEENRKKILADLTDEQTYELVILLQYEYLDTFNQEQSLELYKETVDGYWNNIPELKTDEEKKEYESKLSNWQDTAFEYVDTEEKDQESYLKSVFKEKSYGKALYQILTEYVDEKDDAEKQAESEKAYETLKNGTFEKKDTSEDSKDEKSDTTVDDKKSEETPETEKKEETVETPDQSENEQEPEQKDEQKNEQDNDQKNDSEDESDHIDNTDSSEETAEDLTLTKKELKSLMNSENFDVKKFMKREYESRNFYPIYAGIKSSKKESFLADRTPEELYQIMLMSKYTLVQQYVKYAGMTVEKSDMSDLTAYLSDYQMILEQWMGKENPLSEEQKQQLETEVLDEIAKADKLENIDGLAGYEEYLKQLDVKIDMTGLLDMFGKVDLTSEDTLSTTMGDLLNYSYQLFGMEEEMNGEEVTPKPATSSRRKTRAVMAASTTPSNGSEVAIDDGAYYITAYTSNQALQVDNNGTADQTNVCLWPTNGSGYNRCEQKWIILRQSDGWYKILSNWSRKSLDVYGGGSGNGQNVNLYTDNNSNAQRWKFYYYDGRYVIKSKVGTVVDVPNGDFSNGKNVQTWERNNSAAQQWKLTKITNDTIYLKPGNSTNGHGYLASAPINNMADAYRRIQYTGGTIYVMDTWNVTSTVTLTSTSYANSAASGTTLLKGCSVNFKRYSGFKGNLIGINSSAANATFKNLTFDGNRSAVQKTVAIIAKSVGKLYLSNCTFQNNDAYNNSAAVWVYGNYSTTFDKCTFKNNKSYRDIVTNSDGSGNCTSTVWIQGDSNSNGTATFNDCIFESNTDQSAVTIIGAVGYFNRCTFTKNTNISNDGYAAAIGFNAGDGYLNGCTFDGNSASKDGGVIHVNNQKGFTHADNRGHLEAKDCIFKNNSAGTNAGVIMLWHTYQNDKFDGCQFLSNSSGGGSGSVYIGSYSQATFTNNTFSNNTAKGVGGAINEGSGYGTVSLTATGNTFTNNSCGTRGGAIYTTTKANISDNEFTENRAGKNGGAVAVFSSSSGTTDTIKNNTFTNNSVPTTDTTNGGAVVIASGKAEFSQNIYKGNKATWGGAVDVQASGTATLINETMSDNYGKGEGGAIHNNGTMTITAGLFENNSTGDDGGGAICNTGSLTMNSDSSYDSPGVFRNNTATTFGGAVYSKDQSGSKSTKIVSNGMQYENNTAGTSGGAVAVVFKNSASKYTATLTGNTFTGNTCEGGSGGAVDIESGITGTLSNNTYDSNTANRGGALYNGGTTTLSDEIMESNEVSGNGIGGAIDNEGTLTVNNGYFVNNSSDMYGGAVYNTGSLTLKKNTSGTTTGEFIDNSATDAGGAVYNKMVSQYIDCTTDSTGMTYSGNTAARGGAVYANESTTFTSNGDTFESNEASVEGGAVNILSRGKFIMNNGSMKGNTAPKGSGVSTDGIFRMSGSAVINPEEDVYLYPSRYISVPAALTSDEVATVTPSDYTPGRVVVSNSYSEKGSVLEPKFTLTPKAGYFLRGGDKNGVNDTDVVISENYPVTYDCGTSPNPTGHFSDGTNLDDEDVKEWGVDYEIRTDKPTAKGYLFSGWNTEEDGSGDDYFPGDTYSENEALYLYAQWTPIKYTVAYNGNGSTSGSMLTQTFTYGKSYNLAANGFLRSNYRFAGWNTKADGSGTSYSDKQSVKNLATTNGAKVTLYAQWAKNNYTIRFHANGGTGTMADVTVPYDTSYKLPTNKFTYQGYAFDKWKTEDGASIYGNEATIKYSSAQLKNGVLDLYAQWKINQYTLTITGDSGVEEITGSGTYNYGTTANVTYQIKPGYHIKNITGTTADGDPNGAWTGHTGKGGTVTDTWTMKACNRTIVVHTEPNTYTVKYDGNGNTGGSTASSSHTYDTAKALTANGYTKTGYTFKGWNTKADGSGTAYADKASVKNLTTTNGGTVTLYAQWTANQYQLTLNPNNGAFSDGATTAKTISPNLIYNGTNWWDISSQKVSRTGYTFDGWYDKASGGEKVYDTNGSCVTGTYWKNGKYQHTGNLTVYAQWKANTYTVTIHPNGGKLTVSDSSIKSNTDGTATLTVTYGSTNYYGLGVTAGRTGYQMLGFFDGASNGTKLWNNGGACLKDGKYWNASNQWGYAGNVDVYAQWQINRYTLTITGDSGVESITGNGTYDYGTTVKATYKIKPGYHIRNTSGTPMNGGTDETWTTLTGKEGTLTDNWQIQTCNRNIVVHTEPNTYTVKYDGNGSTGGSTASSSHTYDTAKALTTNGYTRTGYSFNGWNTKVDGSGTAYADKASVKNLTTSNGATVTLYAQWIKNSYYLDLNGWLDGKSAGNITGYGTADIYVDGVQKANDVTDFYQKIPYGSKYEIKDIKTVTGHTYVGVHSGSITGTIGTSNVGVVLEFKTNKYTVTFDKNNGTGTMTNQAFTYGMKQALTKNAFTRTGYTFAGWNTQADGKGTTYTDQQEVTSLSAADGATVRLYAQWTAISYTVTYDGNGSTAGSTASSSHTYDTAKALTANGFTKTGYTFKGWNTKADGSGTSYADKASVKNLSSTNGATVTLYAQWTANKYTVTYNANGGTGTMATDTVSYGTGYVTKTNAFTRTGYTFKGWNEKADGTGTDWTSWIGKSWTWTYTKNITLYAQWTINQYSLIVNPNGGIYNGTSSNTTKTVDYGTRQEVNGLPTKDGYTFQGWNRTGSGSLHSGQASEKSSMITMTEKADTDGTAYTKYTMNYTNSGTGTVYPNLAFFYYPYESGHTYRFSYDVRVNSASGLAYSTMRHSGFRNNWTATSDSLNKTTSGWEHRSMERTFTGTTINQSGTDHTINPMVEFYAAIYAGNTGVFDFDLKNLTVYDVTAGKYVESKTTTVKNGATVDMGAGNTTLTAVWKANSYTIKYNGNGSTGGSTANSSHTYNVEKSLTANGYTRTGYTFKNWNTKADGSGVTYTDKQVVKNLSKTNRDTITLYAQWTANQYQLTLNPNNGSFTDGKTTAKTLSPNLIYNGDNWWDISSQKVSRTGYTFDGWYDKASGGEKVYDAKGSCVTGTYWKNGKYQYTGNLTVYAHWTAKSVIVTFHRNVDSNDTTTAQQTFTYDVAGQKFSDKNWNKTGYTLIGWSENKDATTATYSKNSGVSNEWINGKSPKTDLYAVWKANSYTVKYDGNGSTGGATASSSHTYDTAKALTANGYTRTGYSFNGWNTKADGSGTAYADKASVKNLTATDGATVTLYAQWTANKYTVTYDANGGTGAPAAQVFTYNAGEKFSSTKPARTGYTFVGWKVGTTIYNPADTIPNGTMNLTLKAMWVVNSYRVTFDGNGNTSGTTADEYFSYDESKALTANGFIKKGYNFSKWTIAKDGTGTSYSDKQTVSKLANGENKNISYKGWSPASNKAGAAGNGAKDNGWVEDDSLTTGLARKITYSVAGDGGVYSYPLGTDAATLNALAGKVITVTFKAKASVVMDLGTVGLERVSTQKISLGTNWNTYRITGTVPENWGDSYKAMVFYKPSVAGTVYIGDLSVSIPETVKMYAQWNAKQYQLTLNPNSGSFADGTTTAKTLESKLVYATGNCWSISSYAVAKTGYTLDGWYDKASGGEKVYTADGACVDGTYWKNKTYQYDGNLTVYAHWTANKYTVAYNANGGSGTMATDTVTYGTGYVTKASAFTKTGYTFVGWNEKADGSGTDWTNWIGKSWTWTYTKNITLYAQWKINQYTLTITGDSGVEKITGSGTYNYGTIANVTYQIKPGYHIKNITGTTADGDPNGVWTGHTGKGGTVNDTWTMKACNRTAVVHTEPNTYTIKYDGNGSTGGSTASSSHTYDTAKALTANGYTRTGYSFDGWNTKADGSGTAYADNASVKNLTTTNGGMVTLYAQWTKNSYYLDLNGWLDGKSAGNITGYGTADIYVDGVQKANDVTDFYQKIPYGSKYEIKDIKTVTGHTYVGVHSGSITGTIGTSNVGVVLEFKTNKYTVTFDKNNGTGTMTDQTFTYGVKQALTKNAFTRTGYTFTGWNTKADGSGTAYTDKQEVTSLTAKDGATIMLYAQWKINSYMLTYNPNGGTVTPTSKTLTYGSQYGTLPTPSRTGYTFTGWFTAANGGSKVGTTTTMGAGNTTVYAHWRANILTVNYYPNGATKVDTSSAEDGTAVSTIDSSAKYRSDAFGYDASLPSYGLWDAQRFIRTGYTSTNKYHADSTTGTILLDAGNNVYAKTQDLASTVGKLTALETGDVTLNIYADWKANTYKIVYNGNGNTGGSTASGSHTYDTAKTLTANGFTKTGYIFKNWNTKADGSGTSYADKASVKNLSSTNGATVTLYAQWTANKYTVTYNANGGTGTMANQELSYDKAATLNANTFKRTGYRFNGWSTKADGTGTSYADKASVKNLTANSGGTVTLYAKWYSAAPELEAKDATYYEGQEITKATLLKNVTKASDAEDGDMTGKVIITKIEYSAGKLVDGKSQAAYTKSWTNGMPDSEKLDTWFLQLPKEKAPFTHKITYQVTDLSGKATTKTSTITVKYNEFPVIKAEDRYFTLEDAKAGKITQDVLLKDAITSDKLKAMDAEDGTISNRITIVDYKDTDFKNVNGNTVVWVTFKVKDSMGKETIQEIKVNVIDSGSDYWRDDDEAVRKQVRFITQKYYDKNKDADFHGMTTEEIEASSDNGGLNVMSKWYQNAAYKALLTGSFAKDAGTDYKISAEKAKELKQKIESNGIGNSKSSNALTDIYNSLK